MIMKKGVTASPNAPNMPTVNIKDLIRPSMYRWVFILFLNCINTEKLTRLDVQCPIKIGFTIWIP